MKKILISLTFVASILFLTNCEKEEDLPEYVGKWFVNYSLPSQVDTTTIENFKWIYNLEKGSFTESYQRKYDDNKYYTEIEYKGSLRTEKIEGQEERMMVFEYEQFGAASLNTVTGRPDKITQYYDEDDDEFKQQFSGSDFTEKAVYTIDEENNIMYHWFNWDGSQYTGYIEFTKTL